MYGNDTSGSGMLAVTGVAFGVAHYALIGAILVFAAIALFTTMRVIQHRRNK